MKVKLEGKQGLEVFAETLDASLDGLDVHALKVIQRARVRTFQRTFSKKTMPSFYKALRDPQPSTLNP
jgi:hypothetical protein